MRNEASSKIAYVFIEIFMFLSVKTRNFLTSSAENFFSFISILEFFRSLGRLRNNTTLWNHAIAQAFILISYKNIELSAVVSKQNIYRRV